MLLSLLQTIDRLDFQIQTISHGNSNIFDPNNFEFISNQLIQIKIMLRSLMATQITNQQKEEELDITRIIIKKINHCDNLLENCQNYTIENETNFELL